jgi:tetratricopeptide (TPR) repeat protein
MAADCRAAQGRAMSNFSPCVVSATPCSQSGAIATARAIRISRRARATGSGVRILPESPGNRYNPRQIRDSSGESLLDPLNVMNRKQRRAAKGAGSKSAGAFAAPADRAARLAPLFNAAVTHHHAGQLVEAERSYRQIIAAFPGHAEAHSRLGALLLRQNRMIEAIDHMERALALQPNLFEAHGNLAQAALWMGQGERAIEAACRAVELKETPQSRALFVQCIALARFSTDNGRFRRLLLRAFAGGWMRPRDLNAVCISVIKLNSVVKDAITRVQAIWPARLPADEMLGAGIIAALAQDELLCRLLECDAIRNIGIERLLTNVRCALLQQAMTGAYNERLLGFYCSLARQCFINDYIYTTTESEIGLLARLRCSIEQTIAAGTPPRARGSGCERLSAAAYHSPGRGIAGPVLAGTDCSRHRPANQRAYGRTAPCYDHFGPYRHW